MTIPQAFDAALSRHQAGRLADAEVLYRQILAVQPDHAGALHLLGLIAHQSGRHDLAVDWIRQSLVIDPNNSAAYSNLGEAFRAMGRSGEAIAAYRRALELKPDYPEALNNLGTALAGEGQLDQAVVSFHRALELKPSYPEALNNLGIALRRQGRFAAAVAAYRRALECRPAYPEAFNNLGIALGERGQLDEALAAHRRALELRPDYPEALTNLGSALAGQGQFDEALSAFRRALHLKPDYPEALTNLGAALTAQGQLGEAVAAHRHALQLQPDYPGALNNLGVALAGQSQPGEAIAAYRRALQLKPDYLDALINLGNALKDQGELDEAIAVYRQAIQLKPDCHSAHSNLGIALRDQGELDESIAAIRRAIQMKPTAPGPHSNLVFALQFHPGYDAKTISEERQRWNRQFSEPLKQFILPHSNDLDPDRRLRVGYVSPDFRDHPVGRYILPLFERHDRGQFETLCYSGVARPDWITERLRALAEPARDMDRRWRNTMGLSNACLAEMIREDRVDILVDLAMHTSHRLPVFALQPAPVQVAWLAYPGSTGLPGIGYRLTDAHMDPPGKDRASSTEEPVRLPDCWCCYDPVDESPDINPLPALSAEGVTFGSLNNFAKVHEGVLALWARVLEAVKGSRLVMLCPKGRTQERMRAFFRARGVAAERVECVSFAPRWEYLSLYQRIDIGLDPFPCNGMTTTCDALWMGAPVLTLPGAMPASRAGLSILTSVGLGELAASSEEDYVQIAVTLAEDLPRLAHLRATLRPRMQASPLMDAPRFAQNVETAYRSMWKRWCARQSLHKE